MSSRKQIEDAVLEEAAILGLTVLVPAETLLNGMRDVGLYWSLMGGAQLVPFHCGTQINNTDAWRLITSQRGEFFEDESPLL